MHRQTNPWLEYLQEIFRELDIPAENQTENLAQSIAAYCKTHHPHGVQNEELKLLIARAACAVDRPEVAKKVLQSMHPHARHIPQWIEILQELHHFPQLLPYFSRGIIRPADWAGAALDRMWILDFSRLALSQAEQHEMMIQQSIQNLLEQMAVFWDATSGAGILGLKGLEDLELQKGDSLWIYVKECLKQHAALRHWKTVPSTLNLG